MEGVGIFNFSFFGLLLLRGFARHYSDFWGF
jgi:hypothetical protein